MAALWTDIAKARDGERAVVVTISEHRRRILVRRQRAEKWEDEATMGGPISPRAIALLLEENVPHAPARAKLAVADAAINGARQ